jgi:hypothetical protein
MGRGPGLLYDHPRLSSALAPKASQGPGMRSLSVAGGQPGSGSRFRDWGWELLATVGSGSGVACADPGRRDRPRQVGQRAGSGSGHQPRSPRRRGRSRGPRSRGGRCPGSPGAQVRGQDQRLTTAGLMFTRSTWARSSSAAPTTPSRRGPSGTKRSGWEPEASLALDPGNERRTRGGQ